MCVCGRHRSFRLDAGAGKDRGGSFGEFRAVDFNLGIDAVEGGKVRGLERVVQAGEIHVGEGVDLQEGYIFCKLRRQYLL